MESCFHYPLRTLRTHCYVLRHDQLPPPTFQRFMSDSFRDMIAEGWLVIYMDDLLIYFNNDRDHEEQTKRVLQHMKELDLYLKLEKCSFNISKVEYLRMIVKPGSLAMDPVKVTGIANWPVPLAVKDVPSFLGFANFYRRFVPHYSDTAPPSLISPKRSIPGPGTNLVMMPLLH